MILLRIRQWIATFVDPRPASITREFAERMDAARASAVMEGRVALRETQDTKRKIDSLYDRMVIDGPMRGARHRE